MTTKIDILGRPPVRKAPTEEHDDTSVDDGTDWRGEHHWKVTRIPYGGGAYNQSMTRRG